MKKFLSAFLILVIALLLTGQELDLESWAKSIAEILTENFKKKGLDRFLVFSNKDKETGKYYFVINYVPYGRISKAKIMGALGIAAGDIAYLVTESLKDAKLAVIIPTTDFKFVTIYELSIAECKEGANIEDDEEFAEFIKSHVKIFKKPNK